MAAIKPEARTVYLAPTKGRRYLSARSAASAEARAMLDAKHPAEIAEFDGEGRCTNGGWHWSSDDFLLRVHKRLSRLILAGMRKAAALAQHPGISHD